jgi:magnesium transporter
MMANLLSPEITDLIKKQQWTDLKNIISDWPSPDIASILDLLDDQETVILYRLLPKKVASDVFSKLEPPQQELLVNQIRKSELERLIIDTSYDDRTELFEDLPGNLTQKMLNILPVEERKKSLELLGYPEYSVGRLMTPDYVAVRSDWTIAKCIDHIRLKGRDAETIDSIYVTDKDWHLLDDIPLRRFLLARPEQQLTEIMDNKFISVDAKQDQEEAYHLINRYDLNVLPVTDQEGVLLGIVTVDDIIDVLEEEVNEDFQKTSAISPIDTNYVVA